MRLNAVDVRLKRTRADEKRDDSRSVVVLGREGADRIGERKGEYEGENTERRE